nr:protein DA1-related 2-like [Tanacetum cinerariifolium]
MSSSGNFNHLSQPCVYERKSWFMRWLSKLFKGGSSNRTHIGGTHRPAHFIGDENMVLRAPVRSLDNRSRTDKEKEELDRAIALSLAEGLKKPNGYGWQPKNEDDLAKSVPDDPHSSYPPYVPREYQPMTYRLCGGCNRDIGYGNYLGCMGTFFHPECFCCHACRYPITEHEVNFCFSSCRFPFGFCRLLTGAILAHELMHGWLRLKGYRNLNPEVEEDHGGLTKDPKFLWGHFEEYMMEI